MQKLINWIVYTFLSFLCGCKTYNNNEADIKFIMNYYCIYDSPVNKYLPRKCRGFVKRRDGFIYLSLDARTVSFKDTFIHQGKNLIRLRDSAEFYLKESN